MYIEGIRVVRGPDWRLGDADGGEGHVGTVTKVNADHTVVAQWDMGNMTRCRTGKEDKCDLRVLDSAPAGVRHNGFTCHASDCKQSNFSGTRWRCSQCSEFDFCSLCYFKDKHNIQHKFYRIDAPGMEGQSGLQVNVFGHGGRLRMPLWNGVQTGNTPIRMDCDGDTPIHCGIFASKQSSVAYLLTASNINLSLCNKRGHNPVHLAAMKDDELSLSKLLAKAPEYLDKPQEDGFTPLHLAAVNNAVDAINTLIKLKANVDAPNTPQRTPLHMACQEGYLDASKLLVESGASLSVSDKDGDTPLHLCLLGHRTIGEMTMARLIGLTVTNADEVKERTNIACFLIQKGADITATNNRGRKPLECCQNGNLKMAVQRFADSYVEQISGASGSPDLLSRLPTPCMVPHCEQMAEAIFQPCGHQVCCKSCSAKMDMCPMCREPISERRTLEYVCCQR